MPEQHEPEDSPKAAASPDPAGNPTTDVTADVADTPETDGPDLPAETLQDGENATGDGDNESDYKVEYTPLPGGRHRITTRRTIRRHEKTEDIEETIHEIIPIPYAGPSSDYPTPVG